MRGTVKVALIVTLGIVFGACAPGAQEEILERIERIENNVLPAVLVSGELTEPITIEEILQRFSVPGASVAVVNNGAIEWAKGYGTIEVDGAAVNEETLFLAGQMSQAIATVGALKLVENGSLELDADVNDYLTSWRVPDNEFTENSRVTLRGILTHTSGLSIPYFLGYLPGEPIPTRTQILDGLTPATNEPIRVLAEPGSGQHYSVGGYVVLQQLIEDVTNQTYSSFVDSVVLDPIGMVRSNHQQPLPDDLSSNAARGYEPTNEQVLGRWRIYPEHAAAGMWSTPTDLAKLIVELQQTCAGLSARTLSQELSCEMVSRQFENRGLGFEAGGDGDWRFFRLEGHGNNYLTDMFAYVTQGMGAVVMTNSSHGEGVKAHILRAIASEYGWPDLLPETVDVVLLSEARLNEIAGTYSFRGRDRVLRVEDGSLIQSSEGSPDQRILALSDSLLVSETFGFRYGVDRNDAGEILGLTLILDGTRLFTYERN